MRAESSHYYKEKLKRLADHDLRLYDRKIPTDVKDIKKIHLIGVCGTAMGSLAGLLKEAGYEVSGSDEACYPPMDKQIAELGIRFFEGFRAENVVGADLVVVGNFSGPNNPETAFARDQKLKTLSLPEAFSLFFISPRHGGAGKTSLVVAGTHGKTTTTGLLAHVFQSAGEDPTYLIGGVTENEHHSFRSGDGQFVIMEGDEYDSAYFDKSPKFLHYRPNSAIITSLEFDHIDIYDDLKDYTQAFKFLAEEIPEEGNLILWGDDQNVRNLGDVAKSNIYFYGLKEDNDISARDIKVDKDGQNFTLVVKGKEIGELRTTLHGNHNLLNTLAVCAIAIANGISFEKLKEGLATFKGMKRRQEIVGEVRGITMIDDFAHHPTAVRETIAAIKEKFSERRIVAFFEPRSNTSRRKIFEDDYGKAFDGASKVYLSVPPLRHNDTREDFIDEEKVGATINGRARNPEKAHYYSNADSLLEAALPELKEGDVVLIMSNGAFGGIQQKLLLKLTS